MGSDKYFKPRDINVGPGQISKMALEKFQRKAEDREHYMKLKVQQDLARREQQQDEPNEIENMPRFEDVLDRRLADLRRNSTER